MPPGADAPVAIRRALLLIERFEGLRLRPYLCPAGIWTIGLGSTRYLDGQPVRPTDPPITREHAYALAVDQLRRNYLPEVLRLCPDLGSFDAIAAVLSFAYNCGVAALRASTFRRRLNSGDLPGARRELMKWVRGGGRVLPGLVLRRQAEAALLR